MKTISAALLLLLVMDPFGNLVLFLAILREMPPAQYRWTVLRESLFAFLVLTLFLFGGHSVLVPLHVSESSLGITGGLILFIIAIRMIFPGKEGALPIEGEDPFFVPLAVPLIAGPSAMATVIMLMARQSDRWTGLVALVVAVTISGLILSGGPWLKRVLGQRVLRAIERLMGMLLTTVAVQMFIDGLREAFSLPG